MHGMWQITLKENDIVAGLKASDFKEALAKLLEMIPHWRLSPKMKRDVFQLLVDRECVGTTAIGGGMALPHCFSEDVHEPMVMLGVSPDGIVCPSLDGHPVYFIFMLLLPKDDQAEMRKRSMLQNVKWMLSDRSLQDELRFARSSADIYDCLAGRIGLPPRESVVFGH